MTEHMRGRQLDIEKTHERTRGKYLGRLKDLGLGNPDGIPSAYAEKSDQELQEIARQFAGQLRPPTDIRTLSCIDGRERLGNADGSKPEVRLRRAGGTAPNLAVAFTSEASIVDTLDPGAPIDEQAYTIDSFMTQVTGFERSAHFGGCGKAFGEGADLEAIYSNPAVLRAAKYLLEVPEVRESLIKGHEHEIGQSEGLWDEELARRVRSAAGKTAQFFREAGWDGQRYVDIVTEENPRGVEELEVDEADAKFHGHDEPAVIVVLGDETLTVNSFVVNMKVVKMVAEAFAGQRGINGYKQALIAEVAEAMAVSDRLPSDKTPVLLVGSA